MRASAARWIAPTLAALVAVAAFALAGRGRAASGEAYVPGLGEIMAANQMRHVKLWYAGEAGNWPLAAYEVDELEEGFSDAVRFHPRHEGAPRPLTELVPEFTAGPLAALREAIAGRDRAAFERAYDALTEGCNGCHDAAGFSFNVLQRPTANPYSDQRFEPHRLGGRPGSRPPTNGARAEPASAR